MFSEGAIIQFEQRHVQFQHCTKILGQWCLLQVPWYSLMTLHQIIPSQRVDPMQKMGQKHRESHLECLDKFQFEMVYHPWIKVCLGEHELP